MPHKDPEQARQYRRAYYQANRERILAYNKTHIEQRRISGRRTAAKRRANGKRQQYLTEHATQIQVSQRLYHAKHREKRRHDSRMYRLAHRETLLDKQRTYYAAHREENLAKTHQYYLAHQEELKAKAKARAAADPEKYRKKSRLYRLQHIQACREKIRRYYAANPLVKQLSEAKRRAQKAHAAQTDLTPAQWEEVLRAFHHCCAYCGRKMKRLTQDHITPFAKQGNHTLHNVVPACLSCNSKKHTGPPLVPVQPLLLTIAASKKPKE